MSTVKVEPSRIWFAPSVFRSVCLLWEVFQCHFAKAGVNAWAKIIEYLFSKFRVRYLFTNLPRCYIWQANWFDFISANGLPFSFLNMSFLHHCPKIMLRSVTVKLFEVFKNKYYNKTIVTQDMVWKALWNSLFYLFVISEMIKVKVCVVSLAELHFH
jgi:hypothetical protein